MPELDGKTVSGEAGSTGAAASSISTSQTAMEPEFNKYLKECQHKQANRVELTILVIILIFFLLLASIAASRHLWAVSWISIIIMLTLFTAVLGEFTVCRPMGILINERNLMSLARLQLVLWTLLIGSAYFTIILARIVSDIEDPFNIDIQWEIWALLGITVTSLVGAPLIDSNKSVKEPEDKDKLEQKVADTLNRTKEEVNNTRMGILYGNPDPRDARFTDIFEGNELINATYIDITKLQMFYFTLIAVIVYAWFLLDMFLVKAPNEMVVPALTQDFIVILGISHAGYLGGKSITQTKTSNR